jgi:hypothetical protein
MLDLLFCMTMPTVLAKGKNKAPDTTVPFDGDSAAYHSKEEEEALQHAMIVSQIHAGTLINPASGPSNYVKTSQFCSLGEGHTSMEVSQLKGCKQGPPPLLLP